MTESYAQRVDANSRTITGDWAQVAVKTMAFAGATTNDPGDHDGSNDPSTLFIVTGTVRLRLFAVCTETLTGASATIEVGITGSTGSLIAQTTATDIAIGEIWHDATPDAKHELDTIAAARILANGADIIQTVSTANINDGTLVYYCGWSPISPGASVTAG